MGDVTAITASFGGRFLLLGSTDGIRGYSLSATDPVKKVIPCLNEKMTPRGSFAVGGSVSVVSMLGETPLIAFVLDGGLAPDAATDRNVENVTIVEAADASTLPVASTSRVLYLYDVEACQPIAQLHFETAVVSVRMNCKRLVVALEGSLHVFDLMTLRRLAHLRTTSPRNPDGLLVLSDPTTNPRGDAVSYFAFPQSDHGLGDIWVLQIIEEQLDRDGQRVGETSNPCGNRCGHVEKVTIVNAHRNAVVCIAMTREGTRLATASVRGTTVKVFELATSRLLHVFRRGITSARILSLSFDASSEHLGMRLAALSSHGTLHLFSGCPTHNRQTVTPMMVLSYVGSEIRSFSQATIGRDSDAQFTPYQMHLDNKKYQNVRCCFFSDDGQFVWVVHPQLHDAKCEGAIVLDSHGSGSPLLEKRAAGGLNLILRQYAVRMHTCDLVNLYVLK